MKDVSKKMAKGAAWLVLFRLVTRVIGFISTLILARLLVPEDFGLVAMAMSVLAVLEMLTAFNFDMALVQNQNAERAHYDTAWTMNVLFGASNGILMVLLAVPAANFFNETRIEAIMYAVAANCWILGLGNIGVVAFQKELDLSKEFVMGVAKKIVAFAVTIGLALAYGSYWALIAGTLVSSLVGVALSYTMHPYRPRLSLSRRSELFKFSQWMLLNNLLIAAAHRLPDFFVGRISGPQALGQFTVAYEISNLPTTELVFPISRAVFPGYSKIAQDRVALKNGFLDVLSIVVLITLPVGLGIAVLAEPFVRVLLGEKWISAVPLIQMLAIFGVLRASASNTGAVYLALGKPRILTYLTIFFLVVLVPALYVLVNMNGGLGAAQSILIAGSFQVPIGFALVMTQLEIPARQMFDCVWRSVVSALLMVIGLVQYRSWREAPASGDALPATIDLGLCVVGGAIVYVTVALILWWMNGKPRGAERIVLRAASAALSKVIGGATSRTN